METLTLDQQRAIALASARARAAGASPSSPPERPAPSWLDAAGNFLPDAGNMLKNLPDNIVQGWHQATVDLPDAAVGLATDPSKRAALATALKQVAQNAGNVAGGVVQQVRNLSPPDLQGSAPAMNVAPAQAAETGLKNQIIAHPTQTAVGLATPFIAPEAMAFAGKGFNAWNGALQAGSQALAPRLASVLSKGAGIMDAGATPAAEAVRSAALAKVMAQQQAATGAAVQAAKLKAADIPLRNAMEAAARQQAAKGVAISDIPEAQQLVAALKAKLNPSSEIGTILLPDQAKPYQQIIDTLSPQNGPRPDLESIQNLRRAIAKPAYTGDQSGYNAIPKGDRKDLVTALNGVENAYTGGLQAPVQANYAKMLAAQEQADAAEKMQSTLSAQAAQLDELSPADAVAKAQTIVNGMAKKGLISDQDYRDFIQLANSANTSAGKAAFRKRLAIGIGSGLVGAEALHVGSNVLGAIK